MASLNRPNRHFTKYILCSGLDTQHNLYLNLVIGRTEKVLYMHHILYHIYIIYIKYSLLYEPFTVALLFDPFPHSLHQVFP